MIPTDRSDRVDEIRLVAERRHARLVAHALLRVKDIANLKSVRSAAQPREFERHPDILARIVEQAQVERRQRREMEVAIGPAGHARRNPVTGGKSGAKTLVEIACLRRDGMARAAAADPAIGCVAAVLTTTMPLQANSFQRSLTGTNGFNGTIEGQLVGPVASDSIGGGGAGAVFTFQVSNARADLLFGAIAGEQL